MKRTAPTTRRWWLGLFHSIKWGIIIAILLFVFRDSGPVSRIENITSDWVVSLCANVLFVPTRAVPLIYVDIDEKTYRKWKEPLFLPRDHLAKLITRTLEHRPKLVIVDVDFSGDALRGDGDNELTKAITEAATPILLARTLRPALDDNDEITPEMREVPLLEERETFLDKLTPKPENLHWASVWLRTKPDVVVRSWPLWQPVCEKRGPRGDPPGRPVVLLSMPLAALALARGGPNAFSELESQLNSPAPGSCRHPAERANVKLGLGEQPLDVGEEGRILFTLPWHLPKGDRRPLLTITAGEGQPERQVPLLTTISARALLPDEEDKEGPGQDSALAGSIVVIGGSYSDAHDLHSTPVGQMPGALVLLNAINTALQFQQASLRPAPLCKQWAIEFVVILLVAAMFMWLPIGFATVLSLLLASIVILVVGILWIESGILIGIGAPIIGIILHKWHEDLHHVWQQYWPAVVRVAKFWERHHG